MTRRATPHVYLPLPFLTAQSGRPWVAQAPARLAAVNDDAVTPPADAVVLVLRMPSARAIAHIPDKVPGASCYDQAEADARWSSQMAWERWVDRFLADVIKSPRLTEAQIQALGPDRDALVVGLLRLWSWIAEDDGSLPHMPNTTIQQGLRIMARKSGRLPSQLLDRPFDEFVFDWRVLRVFAPRERGAMDPDDDGMPEGVLPEAMIER